MIVGAQLFSPGRLFGAATLATAVVAGAVLTVAQDLPLLWQVVLLVAGIGLGVLLVLPNRRIALVCAWVLVLPLSLEKVFPIFPPVHREFLAAPLVISGTDVVFLLLLGVLLTEASVFQRRVIGWPAAATPFALLVLWVLLEVLAGSPTFNSFIQVLHWLKMGLVFTVLASAIRTRDELITVLAAVALAVGLQAVILGASYGLHRKLSFSTKVAGGPMMEFSGGDESVVRATGTVGHVNQQAMFHTFFTLPLVAFFALRRPSWRVAGVLVIAASLCAVILTFSRASWIGCGLAGATVVGLAWRHGRISPAGRLALAGGTLGIVLLLAVFSGPMIQRLTKGDDGATSSRLRMAEIALEHVSLHPFVGVGPGNFIHAKLERSPFEWADSTWIPRGLSYVPPRLGGIEMNVVNLDGQLLYVPGVVHNKFLLLTAELGAIGLALFLWFQFACLRHAWRALATKDPVLWWIAAGLVGVWVANQCEFMFELFYDDKTMLMPLFTNVLAITADRIVRTSSAVPA